MLARPTTNHVNITTYIFQRAEITGTEEENNENMNPSKCPMEGGNVTSACVCIRY